MQKNLIKKNIYFDFIKNNLILKNNFGCCFIKMPSYFFFQKNKKKISFLFINKYFYKTFLKTLYFYYKNSFIIYSIKVKLKGLGFKIRQVSKNLYSFFWNYTNLYYLHVPKNIIIKHKKKRMLLISNDFWKLKILFSNILLLKIPGPYRMRGFKYPKQIILLKKKKKKWQ